MLENFKELKPPAINPQIQKMLNIQIILGKRRTPFSFLRIPRKIKNNNVRKRINGCSLR